MILTDLTNTDERYDLILADPPWQQKRGQGNKTARPATAGKPLDYATLTLPEIAEHLLWASRLLPYEGGGTIPLDDRKISGTGTADG